MVTPSTDWDYIVVGGGAAGSALAARISENSAARVLLLEAGKDIRPADRPQNFAGRTFDLDMAAQPDFWWHGLETRIHPGLDPVPFQAGRGVGGTSQVNGLFSIRGVRDDFDRWVARGAAGWSFDEVLPYYRKLEDDHDFPDAPYHGRGGPLPVYREPQKDWGGVDLAFRDAALGMGIAWHDDANAPDSTGLSPFPMHLRDGKRVAANDGYLEPARGRGNLTVRGEALVDSVTFAPDRSTVTGVQLADGETVPLAPGGEVILAAGGTLSPAVLVRSGIGTSPDLRRLGVEQVVELPVGQELTEHPFIVLALPIPSDRAASPFGRTVNVTWRYSSGLGDTGFNDMMIIPNNGWLNTPGVCIWQMHAVSRGRLVFTSRDPLAGPFVEMHMLTDQSDALRAKDALERVGELVHQPAFRSLLAGKPELPSAEELPRVTFASHHVATTARMGSPDDATTVVDPDCRVLGVEGLRVIDQSVMPEVIRGNPLLTVLMLAERMADRIKASHG
ncbi:GMC family oxidoreductase [Streptomyces galbus]|nr:GMC family oxidoreductase N-terminal domain-containing protein [Streptomyces galbus]GHD45635.1 GMC family oxidoreductase [Streptomyces galbus]